MFAKRSVKLDLLALALLALTAFLALALWSYDPADPPGKLVYPAPSQTMNVCGRAGATAAYGLLSAFGLGAYYLVFSLGAFDFVLLARHRVSQPTTRLVGWLISLTALATVVAMALPDWSPGPVVGSGGYLGAAGRGLLEANFARAGAYILLAGFLVGGLLLCTDYLLIGLSVHAARLPLHAAARGISQAHSVYRMTDRGDVSDYEVEDEEGEEEEYETDEEDEAEEDEEDETSDHGVPVRMSGKSDDGTTDEKPARVGKRLAAVLGINSRRKKDERQEVLEEIEAAVRGGGVTDYELPSLDLLRPGEPFSYEDQERNVRRKAKILEKTFDSFGFKVRVVEIETGPVIAQFEIELEAGLRLSKITGLADDMAIALRVPSVRIVAPIPGKNTVGIEVPNSDRQLVSMREVIEEAAPEAQRMRIPVFLGKDVSGNPLICDLAALPHLLIAGRTGTGKSVCLNSIIMSILMTRGPDDVRMLLIDPKMVELGCYMKLPHLMHPVVTDMKKAEAILAWAVEKMEERYALLARAGVRHVSVYNQLGEEELFERLGIEDEEQRQQIPTHLPYIVIVADEMADLMMTSAKEVETHIIRLAQKSRAVGIHLVLATQKPTVDVITGLIKSNLPARISFQVASRTDSRVVLDEMGADKLLGNGDMLFLWPGTSTLLRGQGSFVSDDEIMRVVDHVGMTEQRFVDDLVHLPIEGDGPQAGALSNRDELYASAVDVVVRERRGSVSLLQRTLGIGYGRAARLIDYMAEDGIVGQYNGSQAREVLVSPEQWEEMQNAPAKTAAPVVAVRPAPSRSKLLTASDPQTAATRAKKRRTVALREQDRTEEEPPFEDDQAVSFQHAQADTALADGIDPETYEDDAREEDESDDADTSWTESEDELTADSAVDEEQLEEEEEEYEEEEGDEQDELEEDEYEDGDDEVEDEYEEEEYEEDKYETEPA